MKTLLISLALVLSAMVTQAQQVTELPEVRLGFAPINAKIVQYNDSFVFKVRESYAREFAKDPIGFMFENFDINNFIAGANKKHDFYLVTLKSSNGSLFADFDYNGELLSTTQNFKNVILPKEINNQVFRNYEGWAMVKNKYVAKTKGELVKKEIYEVTLENGDKRINVKVDGLNRDLGIASN